jgi:hypothetical protein
MQSFHFIGFALIAGLITVPAGAQSQVTIDGPRLGFVASMDGTVIWPVIGVPGASAFGNPLNFGMDIGSATISPKLDYAIGKDIRDGQMIVLHLTGELGVTPIAGTRLAGTHLGSDVIGISPSGSAAAIYHHDARIIEVVGHLPSAPEVIQQFDISQIPGSGTDMTVTNVTVADDGSIALVKVVDHESAGLWVITLSAVPWRVWADQPSAAAFFPNSHNAIVGDDATQTVFVLMDIARTASSVPLISGSDGIQSLSGISFSDDSRRVFLTDPISGAIAIVDMETRRFMLVSCRCEPTGLYPLKGSSTFRLTEPTGEPLMMLDASRNDPRILMIPPTAAEQQ